MRHIYVVLFTLALLIFLGCSNFNQQKESNLPKFMVWTGGHSLNENLSDKEIEEYLKKLHNHKIRGILLNVGNDLFKRIAPIAVKNNIQLHAWRPTMVRFNEEFMNEHKSWYAVNKNGVSCVDEPPYVGYYRWLCPTEPKVLEYLTNDYLALAEIDGISGIHFDYIRYCDIYLPIGLLPKYNLVQDHEMPEFDFCYCNRCRDAFKSEFGRDPIEIEDPANDLEWKNWRLNQIAKLVNSITHEVKSRTNKFVSAAVFPTPTMSANMVRQDWSKFEIDAVMPMLYNGFYNQNIDWIGECVSEGVQTMEFKKALHAGVFLNDLKDPSDLKKAIDVSFENGAEGIVFFAAHSLTDEHLELIKNYELEK